MKEFKMLSFSVFHWLFSVRSPCSVIWPVSGKMASWHLPGKRIMENGAYAYAILVA